MNCGCHISGKPISCSRSFTNHPTEFHFKVVEDAFRCYIRVEKKYKGKTEEIFKAVTLAQIEKHFGIKFTDAS